MKKSILKWSLIVLGSLILLILAFGIWFMSLLPPEDAKSQLSSTLPTDLPYLTENEIPDRGKILAVVTSCDTIGSSSKRTGYELTELARAYYVFQANGFEVDVASPLGGEPPVVIDWEDMGSFDFAFLNDSIAQHKTHHSIPVDKVNAQDYEAVFFVGGKGAVFDFPDNEHIQSIVRQLYDSGKVIGAVCHGPAAMLNVKLENGSSLLANKKVCGFTNEEELLLIPEAREIFPFLLQDQLTKNGAYFNEGHMYLENVTRDGRLITGQNPWSTWTTAEAMIEAMGYHPKHRVKTAEENTIQILQAYENDGYGNAKGKIRDMIQDQHTPIHRMLIAMHGMVAAWQWELGKTFDLILLLHSANE